MADPYFADDRVSLYVGDCLTVLADLADASVDAIVTDPPYGLAELSAATVLQAISAWMAGDRTHVPDGTRGFMGREWDRFVPPPGVWDECLRVLRPGGHLLCFAAPRTVDLMTLSIRLAGFEIRDSIHWVFGGGMPKSLDVSKAIDKAAGAEREVIGPNPYSSPGRAPGVMHMGGQNRRPGMEARMAAAGIDKTPVTAPATEDAARWSGWGTALKPGYECVVLARAPLSGTVARNVTTHGTGALNIDGCRIEATADLLAKNPHTRSVSNGFGEERAGAVYDPTRGRWPTNVVFSHLPECGPDDTTPCADGCAVIELDRQSGVTTGRGGDPRPLYKRASGADKAGNTSASYGAESRRAGSIVGLGRDDSGGASRFFPVFRYEAKASAAERPKVDGVAHECVKPLALIRWLARLVTPPGGTVLDPFLGSGTTAEACLIEGFRCVGIERDERYLPLIEARLGKPVQPVLGLELDAP